MSQEKIHGKDWVPVTDPMFEKDADVIGDILIAAGIPAKLDGPNGQRYYNFSPQLKTAQVLVPKHLLTKARALLDAKEKDVESR